MRAGSSAIRLRHIGLNNTGIVLLLLPVGAIIAFLPLTLAGVIVVGVIVLGFTLIRLEYGLCLLILAVPFGSVKQLQAGSFTISAAEVLTVVLACAWLARMMARRKIAFEFTRLFPPLAVFLAVLSLSIVAASSLAPSLKEILKWLELSIVFLVVVNSIKEERQVDLLLGFLLAAGLLQALYGTYQFFTRSGPEGFLLGARFMRAFGTFGQPNPYAGYLGLILPLAVGLSFSAIARRDGFESRKILLFGSVGLVILAAMLMSLSRGAWLAFFAAISIIAALASRRFLIYFAFLLLLVVILVGLGAFGVLPEPVTARLSMITDYVGIFDVRTITVTPDNWAIVERMANWQAAWEMFCDHPLLGVGIGNYGAIYPSYALAGWENTTGHAHNYYLNLLAETGIIGLSAYLVFWLVAFIYAGRTLVRLKRDGRSPRLISEYGVVLGIIGVMVALSVHNLFDSLYVHSMAAQIGLALGLLAVMAKRADIEAKGVIDAPGLD